MLRVTQIIRDAGLAGDFTRIDPVTLNAAIARGNAVHRAVEIVDDGDLDRESVPDELRGYVAAYDAWRHVVSYVPIATEVDLRHPSGYAGRPDKIGWIYDERWLVDIKTSLAVNPGPLLLQLAAYWGAWPHTFPDEPLGGVGCLQLRPDGSYRWRRHEMDTAWSVFCAATALVQARATAADVRAIDAWSRCYPT